MFSGRREELVEISIGKVVNVVFLLLGLVVSSPGQLDRLKLEFQEPH